jgi:hypothetical protein
VLWLAVAGAAIVTVLLAVAPVLDVDQQGVRGGALMVDNPLSPTFVSESLDVRAQWWYFLPLAVCLASVLVAIVSAVVRFHRSAGVERQQMRLFAIAIVLLPFAMWITVTFAIALTIIPVACGLAILRYHLYDIDRIIGRTTAYALVTGTLLLVYVAVVTTITQFVPESNSLAVAAATLSAAAAFRPVLGWAQRLVNRRFNREQYDAERSVREFAARLRDQVDPDSVSLDLFSTLDRTLQPASVGLWLVPCEVPLCCGGATCWRGDFGPSLSHCLAQRC